MAAIDNKHLVEILKVNKESGHSKRTGKDWEMFKAQCVIRAGDGIQVGVLNLPRELESTPAGKYLAEFELGVSMDRMLVPVITQLHPYGETAKAVPTPKASA